jgi:uncharacterized protein (TIGR02246 family)
MSKLALALSLLAFAAPATAEEGKAGAAQNDPMAGWKPPKVTHEAQDRKEISALFKAMEDAGQKGDLDAAAALVDFPVLMVTDDSKGQAMAETWSREKWTQAMAPFYKQPMPAGMKIAHRPAIFLLSDSLASVNDQQTTTMGKRKVASRSCTLLVRRDGRWRIKSMTEGGWGDAMAEHPGSSGASGTAAPAGDAPTRGQ